MTAHLYLDGKPYRYLMLILSSSEPIPLLRVPTKGVRWRALLTAMTPILHAHGLKRSDLSSIDGFDPWHTREGGDSPSDKRARAEFFRMDMAFIGDTDCFRQCELWAWNGSAFELVREALEGKKQ